MIISRRQLLAATGYAAASGSWVLPRSGAIDPIRRPSDKPDLKLALAAYSFRQYLDLKKPTMTLFDFIDLAAELPLDAVELTSYYWAEATEAYADKLKAHAAKKKLAISGVPVRSDFCTRDEAKRKADIEHVKRWLALAARVGATTVRIFAGTLPKGDTLEEAQKRVVAAINECCEAAEKYKVYLALENHGGITDTPENLLALVKPVKSAWLGVNIDTGNFRTADPYADIAAIVEAFEAMQLQLIRERRAMKKQWAEREKQIARVVGSTSAMYGALQGIVGAGLAPIPALELDDRPLLEDGGEDG